jgi:dCMP deaminase
MGGTEVNTKRDNYFMSVAKVVSKQSNCLSRKVGVVVVKDDVIICEGWNSPARKIPHCQNRNPNKEMICPRKLQGFKSGEGLHLCLAVHGECSAITQAARLGIKLKGTKFYIWAEVYPCKDCLSKMINSGVSEVVIDSRAEPYDELSDYILSNSNIVLRKMECNEIT